MSKSESTFESGWAKKDLSAELLFALRKQKASGMLNVEHEHLLDLHHRGWYDSWSTPERRPWVIDSVLSTMFQYTWEDEIGPDRIEFADHQFGVNLPSMFAEVEPVEIDFYGQSDEKLRDAVTEAMKEILIRARGSHDGVSKSVDGDSSTESTSPYSTGWAEKDLSPELLNSLREQRAWGTLRPDHRGLLDLHHSGWYDAWEFADAGSLQNYARCIAIIEGVVPRTVEYLFEVETGHVNLDFKTNVTIPAGHFYAVTARIGGTDEKIRETLLGGLARLRELRDSHQ